MLDWLDYPRSTPTDSTWPDGTVHTVNMTPEEARLQESFKGQTVNFPEGNEIPPLNVALDADLFITGLVETEVEHRWLKRKCHRYTMFRLQNEDEWYQWDVPYSAEAAGELSKRYGERLVEVGNTRFA